MIFCFPQMFRPHIENSDLKCPPDYCDYDREEYPNFHIFMMLHLENEIRIDDLKDNANIIASIDSDKIKTMKIQDFIELGVNI